MSDDLVSRQIAKDAICNACGKIDCDQMDTCEMLMLPSAQPELPEWAQKVEEYRKSAPKTFSSPIAWALYQTWREYAERRTDDR